MAQRILTLWGLLSFDQSTESFYGNGAPEYLARNGYVVLNGHITSIAKHTTIHSVSYSHITFPKVDTEYVVQFFATILYTGPSPRQLYGANHPDILGEISEDATILQVLL